jgi:hypothetical protein
MLVIASGVILRSKSRGTHDHILPSQIRVSPNLEGQISVFISPRNKVVQSYPQALGSIVVTSYNSRGSTWDDLCSPPHLDILPVTNCKVHEMKTWRAETGRSCLTFYLEEQETQQKRNVYLGRNLNRWVKKRAYNSKVARSTVGTSWVLSSAEPDAVST